MENPHRQRTGFINKNILFQAGIAIVGAAASVACFRSGYLIVLFLLPLAFSAFLGNAKTAWAAGILATVLNFLVLLWFFLYLGENLFLLQWNALYYSVMVLVFTWINVPLGRYWEKKEVPFRMTAGAAFCVVLFIPVFLFIMQNSRLLFVIGRQLETIGSVSSSPGQSYPTTEELVSSMIYMILRGGIALSCLVFWWINRQIALLISRLLRRSQVYHSGTIINFRAPFFFVWVISLSLGAILLGRVSKIELLEIGGWNILILSATLFLVQGGSILMHFLVRFPPLPRIIINVGIIFLFFRPKINVAILGLLVLLGIMENWVPFRAPKQ